MAGTCEQSFGDFSHVNRVGVLGAGVAGLQVAEQLSLAGLECVLFEKADDVGGVWRQNYADFGLQVPKELYEFPSFPFPAKYGSFPKGPEVQEYLRSFAHAKGIYAMTRLRTAVLAMVPRSGGSRGWRLRFQTEGAEPREEDFDFVIVATGMYGTPLVPEVPGMENFRGVTMHAEKFYDKAMAIGQKVIVVGGGKSAIDCAVAAAKVAESSTLLFREVHWPVPRYLLDLVPFKWGTYSRFGHATLPMHWDLGRAERCLHCLAAPLKWLWWRTVELMFRFQFRLSGEFVPTTRLDHDVFTGGQILSYEFRDMLRAGKVSAQKGAIARFTRTGVVLTDGSEMQADMVVFGTGFTKSYAYLDPSLRKQLNREQDGLYLYRNMFPTQVPDLCFVGSEVSTFNNILTQGLQALWLRHVLTGHVTLPSLETMDRAIDTERAWKRSWMPKKGDRAAILQLHKMSYHDQLCKDMAVNPCRKGWNLLAEAFAPYSATDYSDLFPSGGDHATAASAAEMEASRGWAGSGLAARAILVVALLAIVLTFMALGGSVKAACLAGGVVLCAPTLFDVMSLFFTPKWLLSASASRRTLLRQSRMSRSAGL
jgi:cation diffusion facilitator CzcD-associated flavoprotein CzcO